MAHKRNANAKSGKAPKANARRKAADNAIVTRNAKAAKIRKALRTELAMREFQATYPSLSPNGEWD